MDLNSRYNAIIKKIQSISTIQSGQYWSTSYQRPQFPSLFNSFSRTLHPSECREYNLQDIETSYDTAFTLINY